MQLYEVTQLSPKLDPLAMLQNPGISFFVVAVVALYCMFLHVIVVFTFFLITV